MAFDANRGCGPAGVWPAGHRNQLSTGDHTYVHTGASPLPFHCPVDGGTSDAEQVGEFSGAVVPAVEQSHQMRFLPVVQLGLLAAQPSFGSGDLHALPSAQTDQVSLNSATMASTLKSNRPTG
jgi:hypothetical protein